MRFTIDTDNPFSIISVCVAIILVWMAWQVGHQMIDTYNAINSEIDKMTCDELEFTLLIGKYDSPFYKDKIIDKYSQCHFWDKWFKQQYDRPWEEKGEWVPGSS